MQNLKKQTGFKTFIMRGNVVDLAIGVVIGAAFTSVINSLVTDIVSPTLAGILNQPDFTSMVITLNGSIIRYGKFMNSAITFLIVAIVVYYFVVIPLNKLFRRAGIETVIGEKAEEKKK